MSSAPAGNAPGVVEPPEGVARQDHRHRWRFVDAAMVAPALGLAAVCLALDLNGALRLLGLPPDAVSTPWIRDEFTTLRSVGVVVAVLYAGARIGFRVWPALVEILPARVSVLLAVAATSPVAVPLTLVALIAGKTALQLLLYAVGYTSYGADDFSRSLNADYWLYFKRFDFGWEGWLGLSGSGWLPFPDYLFGAALAVHRDLFLTPRFVNLALSAALVLGGYVLGRDLFGKVAGLCAAALLAFQPWHVWLGMSGMTSDVSSITVLVLFAAFLVRWLRTDGALVLLCAAACLGVASGFRYENWFFSLVMGLVLVGAGVNRWKSGTLTGRWLLTAAAASLLMAAFPVYWMTGSFLVLGDWLPSLHSTNAWMVTGVTTDAPADTARLAVSQSPAFPQLNMLLLASGAFPLELTLAVAGALLAFRNHRDAAPKAFFLFLLGATVVFFAIFKGQLPASIFYVRFMLPFVVLALPYAGFFLASLLRWSSEGRLWALTTAGLVIAAVAALDVGRAFNYPDAIPRDAIGLGRTLRDLQESGTVATDAKILLERSQDWGDLGIVALANRPERFVALREFEYRRLAARSLPPGHRGAFEPPLGAWKENVRGDVCNAGFQAEACWRAVLREQFDLVILSSPDYIRSFAEASKASSWSFGRYRVFDLAAP
jgi:dolichyl-phosphate-mannose-protein mannosyltransferase